MARRTKPADLSTISTAELHAALQEKQLQEARVKKLMKTYRSLALKMARIQAKMNKILGKVAD